MWHVDRLQVLKRDKRRFQVRLMNKDLKILAKDKRDELLSTRVYMDCKDPSQESVLVIDMKPAGASEAVLLQIEEVSNQASSNTNNEVPAVEGDEAMQDESEPSSNAGNEQRESANSNGAPKKKKKRKGMSFSSSSRRSAGSKNLQNLPPYLSDFTWIENTDENKALLNEEKQRISEQKKLKEIDKKRKSQEETLEENKQHFNMLDSTAVDSSPEPKTGEPIPQTTDVSMIDTTAPQQKPLTPVQDYKFESRYDIETLDDIWERAENWYYHSLSDLVVDLELVVQKSIAHRCLNSLSKVYLTNVLTRSVILIKAKSEDYKQRWRSFYDSKFAFNDNMYPKVRGSWYKEAGPKRDYNRVDNYKIATPQGANPKTAGSELHVQQEQDIKRKMKTSKKAKCNGECCLNIENLGPFKIGQDMWETICPCRGVRVECNDECGCDPSTCQNRQMTLKQGLKLGEDIIEKISWGIDMCTAVNLLILVPKNVPIKMQSEFIEQKVVFAIQQQGEKGYDMREALRFIIREKDNHRFTEFDREMAHVVLSGINMVKDKVETHFRVHSKGIGIFCKRRDGIKASNLIVEYFGEIYQPWSWYEKQDVLKQGQNKSQLSKELPDFYNITYERHNDDPLGYDILMVDPILYGNYSSRLSHSCNPNSSTIIQVRNGEYSIGMYALKDIKYGEELCFNYCSLTESEKEYESAVCLCGTEICSGRYLQLASDKKHLALMKKYHTFIDRNYILFKAIQNPEITEEDESRLQMCSLKDSVMQDVPNWLKKWASLICEYCLFEESKYPAFFKADFPHLSENDLKLDAKNSRDSKISNIAITVDKIMHVLKSMGTYDPPIRELTFKEKYHRLWESKENIRDNLLELLHKLEASKDKDECIQILKSSKDTKIIICGQNSPAEHNHYKQLYSEAMEKLAAISTKLRAVSSKKVVIPALCDILWLYSNIQTYFTPSESYHKTKGDEQKIRKCDVRMANVERIINEQGEEVLNVVDQEKGVYRGSKEYDPGYIWGQLIGWFKQTVDKPNASLSAERRGTLSMPDIESFQVTFKNQEAQSGKSKKKKKDDSDAEDEVSHSSGGSRTRPGASAFAKQNSEPKLAEVAPKALQMKKPEQKEYTEIKIVYPHKKHQTRQAYLENWPENFSKQWDVCCNWSFKNRNRMYGSIQFESVIAAGSDRDKRLDLFKQIVSEMQKYK